MQGVCEGIRDGKAIRLASPMLSMIAKQKDAEHANHAALLSVARLKVSRAAGLAPAARAAGSGKSGLTRNTPQGSVDESPEGVVAHAK